jgi:hypothetical protein
MDLFVYWYHRPASFTGFRLTDHSHTWLVCTFNIFFNCVPYAYNPLNAKANPICHLMALLGAHHILHVSKIRVK